MNRNICFILPTDSPTGAEQVMKQLAQQHLDLGDNVLVVILSPKTFHFWTDMECCADVRYAVNIGTLLSLLRSNKRVYVRLYTTHTKVTALVESLRRCRLISVSQFVSRESTTALRRFSGIKLFLYRAIYRYVYKSIDLLVCQTELMRSDLLGVLGSSRLRGRSIVLPNPLAPDFQQVSSQPSPYTFPYIMAAGRFIKEKGFDILLQSFARLLPTLAEDWKLVIAGDGELNDELRGIASELSISDRVVFPGMVRNIAPYFANAELCVCSSRIEGFPNVLLQMMSQNTRVVSTLCAGDIDKINGIFTCVAGDEIQLSSAMSHCLQARIENRRDIFDDFLQYRTIATYLKSVDSYFSR